MKATQICSVEGCERPDRIVRGLCRYHYRRARDSGDLDLLRILSPAERLAAGLVKMASGCLEWTKGTNEWGYGIIGVGRRSWLTHRLAWSLVNGPIPDGLHVLHHCDNRPCCETAPSAAYPDGHLFLGTQTDNLADMNAKGRHGDNGNAAKTHCPQGHEYAGANLYVNPQGKRHCRTCQRAHHARRLAQSA